MISKRIFIDNLTKALGIETTIDDDLEECGLLVVNKELKEVSIKLDEIDSDVLYCYPEYLILSLKNGIITIEDDESNCIQYTDIISDCALIKSVSQELAVKMLVQTIKIEILEGQIICYMGEYKITKFAEVVISFI